jgi:hypothetical protein
MECLLTEDFVSLARNCDFGGRNRFFEWPLKTKTLYTPYCGFQTQKQTGMVALDKVEK